MKKAYIFPGQGAQFPGMGKDLLQKFPTAQKYFDEAKEILGFNIQEIMFDGDAAALKQTKVTQPAVFLHSVLAYLSLQSNDAAMTAGHSLGEFSALVAAGVLNFSDALSLVAQRAKAMQEACELQPSTMAAVLGLDDEAVVACCEKITEEVVVAANFNCPGQIVISGSMAGIALAEQALKDQGAKRVLPLQVGGAFHSPLMMPAQEKLAAAIAQTNFSEAVCPVYQNIDGKPYTAPDIIKENLIKQLTGAVRWTQCVQNMVADGATNFVECGPGAVLQGLVKKIATGVSTEGVS